MTTMTRRSSRKNATTPECHVLNFFCDDVDGCAFTTLVRGFRFHIIVDGKTLNGKIEEGRELERKYRKLVRATRKRVEKDGEVEKLVKANGDKGSEKEDTKEDDDADYRDSALGSSPPQVEETDEDSAVDVVDTDEKHDAEEVGVRNNGVVLLDAEEHDDPEKALQNWLVQPFAQIFQDLESPDAEDAEDQTIEEWYSGPTYFYSLELKGENIEPVEQESQPNLEDRITNLVPRMSINKSLRSIDVPWIHTSEVIVVSESSESGTYHPSRVRVNDKIHFFKAVDMTQPQTMKRELKIMMEIEKKGLHEKIRVPRLTGLVGFETSNTEIMGFLMTDIEDPTPLTKMLDTDVIEDEREKWARETRRMVKVLHDNNIIWGDAKADNFLVDRHGHLWIIDFGGSYTDGWVDPELMETIEGDNMGTEKIVNALEDPESNTYDPEETKDECASDKSKSSSTKGVSGRKRSRDDVEESTEDTVAKRRRS